MKHITKFGITAAIGLFSVSAMADHHHTLLDKKPILSKIQPGSPIQKEATQSHISCELRRNGHLVIKRTAGGIVSVESRRLRVSRKSVKKLNDLTKDVAAASYKTIEPKLPPDAIPVRYEIAGQIFLQMHESTVVKAKDNEKVENLKTFLDSVCGF